MPSSRKYGPTGGSNAVSLPLTRCPSSTSSAESALMPVPDTPIK